MQQFRQGDILIEAVSEIPTDAAREIVLQTIVLATGEATGHEHVIRQCDDVEVYRTSEDRYLRINNAVSVTHEEHGPLLLPAGLYRVIHQREYFPSGWRNVSD
jgi:hypothetical protein